MIKETEKVKAEKATMRTVIKIKNIRFIRV